MLCVWLLTLSIGWRSNELSGWIGVLELMDMECTCFSDVKTSEQAQSFVDIVIDTIVDTIRESKIR